MNEADILLDHTDRVDPTIDPVSRCMLNARPCHWVAFLAGQDVLVYDVVVLWIILCFSLPLVELLGHASTVLRVGALREVWTRR